MQEIADDDPPSLVTLAMHLASKTIWVAVDADDHPIGYATASFVDREGHLDQVSVHPDRGRRGAGRALVEAVCDWARALGLSYVTLTTFRDLPWNAPLYERYGFTILVEDDCGPELTRLRAVERADGLDVIPRVAMRRTL